MDQQEHPDGRPQQAPQPPVDHLPSAQPPLSAQQPPAASGFPTPAAWRPAPGAPGQQPQPQQAPLHHPQTTQPPYGESPSAPPAGWQGERGTYLQTVPTAVYQAPSPGGYAPFRAAGPDAPAAGTTRSTWSLVTGLVGLVISIFVGWGFAFSIVAIVLGILGRRREPQARGRALTGIVTGAVGLLCSVGWFVYSIVVIIGYVST